MTDLKPLTGMPAAEFEISRLQTALEAAQVEVERWQHWAAALEAECERMKTLHLTGNLNFLDGYRKAITDIEDRVADIKEKGDD